MTGHADNILSVLDQHRLSKRRHQVSFLVTTELHERIKGAALSRGMSASRLCNKLISTIARDNLFKAVLMSSHGSNGGEGWRRLEPERLRRVLGSWSRLS